MASWITRILLMSGFFASAFWASVAPALAQDWYVHRRSYQMREPPYYCYCYGISTASVLAGVNSYPVDMAIPYDLARERMERYATLPETCPGNCSGIRSGNDDFDPSFGRNNLVRDADFRDFGTRDAPWGTGQYESNGVWWNSRGARSEAYTIPIDIPGHVSALYIRNDSGAAAHVYGTTSQRIRTIRGQRYTIRVLAAAHGLASRGGLSIAVDQQWRERPIAIDAGDYEPQPYQGSFVASGSFTDLQIIMQDRGEVILTGLTVTPQ